MKLTKDQIHQEYELGRRRANQENSILNLMFNGSSNLRFLPGESYRTALFIHEASNLRDFCDYSDTGRDNMYLSLPDDFKVMCRVLAGLDSLVKRDLVKRKIWASNDFAPEDGWSDEEGNSETWFDNTILVSRALCSTSKKERECNVYDPTRDTAPVNLEIEAVCFQLTSKGYDVALTLQEHRDQEDRFTYQTALSERAIDVSESSVQVAKQSTRIARAALLAALFIAIGSIGNLGLSIYKFYYQEPQASEPKPTGQLQPKQ